MEYYAKSPTKKMTDEEREELLFKLHEWTNTMKGYLSNEEIKVLERYERDLKKEQKNEHKTLTEHISETINCAENFFSIYGDYFTDKEKKLVLIACREHDVGKTNLLFQIKVNPKLTPVKSRYAKEIPHGFLSALCMNERAFLKNNRDCDGDDFSVLLTAVYFHHNRQDTYDDAYFNEYFEKFYLEYIKDYKNNIDISFKKANHGKLLFSNCMKANRLSVSENIWCEYMIVKGLLNKFDWTVSAGYDDSETETDRNKKQLCTSIIKEIHENLRPVQEFMLKNNNRNIVVIAPTGSGKTEASLLWLNGEKGFYTLPLKVSSNAIYRRIKERYRFKNTALLHSDSISIYLKESADSEEDGYSKFEQAKLLSYPLTVCTVDQLFKFVYKALGTEIFAATLKYSKIIIDEIQTYSPNIVAALLYGLSVINRMGGRFAIVTATFPPVLKYFMKKCKLIETRDYIYGNFTDSDNSRRHRIHIVGESFNIEDIIHASHDKKVLVICNTVSKAQKLYCEIRDKCENVRTLHSRFIREHRNILENDIIAFSKDKYARGIWITTQVVEASLDIDFDILYTEMCTADSLLQRMGRCNRAGKKSTKNINVFIYNNPQKYSDKVDGIYDEIIYSRSVEFLREYEGKIFSEDDKNTYINNVYNIDEIRDSDYFKEIQENIEKFNKIEMIEYSLNDVNEDFRNIHSITVMPDKIYYENQELIDNICNFLKTPHLHQSVRKILKMKITSITLDINLWNKNNYPQGIDSAVINNTTDIHRANLKYDFDEESRGGAGLFLDRAEDDFLIL